MSCLRHGCPQRGSPEPCPYGFSALYSKAEKALAATSLRYPFALHSPLVPVSAMLGAINPSRDRKGAGASVLHGHRLLRGFLNPTGTGAALTRTTMALKAVSGNQSRLIWVNRDGEEQPLRAASRGFRTPRVLSDGRRVAVLIADQQIHIGVSDTTGDNFTRLTFEGTNNNNFALSPDGRRIAFTSNRTGRCRSYIGRR